MMNSIKAKFILWSCIIFAVLGTGLGFSLYEWQKVRVFNTFDASLIAKSSAIKGTIEVYNNGRIHHGLSNEEKGIKRTETLYDIPNSGHYFRILFNNGKPLASSLSIGDFQIPLPEKELAEKEKFFILTKGPAGEPVRVLTEKAIITSPDHSKSYTFIVQTAESLEGVYSLLSSLRKNIIIGITLSILVFISIGSLILYISLRPLTKFSEEIVGITESNLDKRLQIENVTKELRELARAFNQMMNNLEKAFNIERRFISDASHELRTPVSVIKSCCEVYTKRQRDEKEYKEALNIIYGNVMKMESIVERLLLLSRLDEKRLPMKITEISLNEVVDTGVKLLKPAFELKNMSLSLASNDNYFVMADKDLLTEAFLNIIDNAIKYSPMGSDIEIRLNKTGHEACVEIEDHGIGIPEEEIEKIFYRFYRVKDTDTTQKGMGLGLSIAKEIIEASHGRIEVKSSIGKGSIFSLCLPLSQTKVINR